MRCSICKTELVRGEDKKYETLMDHVMDPNLEDYPLRPTFVCPNPDCPVHGNSFWSPDGEFFTNLDYEEYLDFKDNKFVDGIGHALDSSHREAKVYAEEVCGKEE